jgi:hypothetical protein
MAAVKGFKGVQLFEMFPIYPDKKFENPFVSLICTKKMVPVLTHDINMHGGERDEN